MLLIVISKLLDFLETRPLAGFFTSVSGWFLGSIPLANISLLQENLLWHLQIISLVIGCLAGIFTILSLIRKKKNEK